MTSPVNYEIAYQLQEQGLSKPCSGFYYEKCAECDDEVTCGIRHAFMAIRNETVELLKKDTLEMIIKNEQKLIKNANK